MIHQQEKIFVREVDYDLVRHVLRVNKKDLQKFIEEQLAENDLKNVQIKIKANRLNGYYVRIRAEW